MISLTSLAVLASSALAAPTLPSRQSLDIPSNWTWHVSGWQGMCVRSGCNYVFNVTIPSIEGQILGVKAYCSGDEDGITDTAPNAFRNCQILEGANNGVAAKFSPREADLGAPKQIVVSFQLQGNAVDRPTYNYTGEHEAIYNAFVAPAQEFDITPTEVTGVL